MARCPPGVFCIESMTLLIVIVIAIGVVLFIQNDSISKMSGEKTFHSHSPSPKRKSKGLFSRFNYTFSDTQNDVLLNPYEAPLRDDRIFQGGLQPRGGDIRGIPINIATQSVDTNYRQVGILTRINGPETILPLMGRPLIAGRDTWNFYTMSDQNNMVKLPITFKNKNCSGEYGCDNIFNGDTVYVEGYNDAFRVTMYENNTMRYIPYI